MLVIFSIKVPKPLVTRSLNWIFFLQYYCSIVLLLWQYCSILDKYFFFLSLSQPLSSLSLSLSLSLDSISFFILTPSLISLSCTKHATKAGLDSKWSRCGCGVACRGGMWRGEIGVVCLTVVMWILGGFWVWFPVPHGGNGFDFRWVLMWIFLWFFFGFCPWWWWWVCCCHGFAVVVVVDFSLIFFFFLYVCVLLPWWL